MGLALTARVEHGERALGVALVEQHLRKVHRRFGELRIELERGAVVLFGEVEVRELFPRDAEVIRGLRVLRILSARVEEDVPRLFPLLFLEQEDALLNDVVRRLFDGRR